MPFGGCCSLIASVRQEFGDRVWSVLGCFGLAALGELASGVGGGGGVGLGGLFLVCVCARVCEGWGCFRGLILSFFCISRIFLKMPGPPLFGI